MTDSYDIQSKLREKLSDWPPLKIRIATELCLSYAEGHEDRLQEIAELEDLHSLYFMHPLSRLEDFLSPLDLEEGDRGALAWTYPSFLSKNSSFHLDLNLLSECARRYTYDGELESRTLELWLSRWMIYEENVAFSREIGVLTNPQSWSKFWGAAQPTAIYLLSIISAIYIGAEHSAALGFVVFVLMSSCCRAFTYIKAKELQTLEVLEKSMRRVFACSMQDPPSPHEIQIALSRSTDLGAVWPHHLHDLVEQAKRRDFSKWL